MNELPEDPVLKTSQAAPITGCSPRTLEKLRLQGGGPAFFKIGRSVRYRRSDLIAWLEQFRCSSTADFGRQRHGGR